MEKLLAAKQLSELLQVKMSTIRKRTHYGFIPHIKLGGSVRYKESKIEEWVNKREKQGRKSYCIVIK